MEEVPPKTPQESSTHLGKCEHTVLNIGEQIAVRRTDLLSATYVLHCPKKSAGYPADFLIQPSYITRPEHSPTNRVRSRTLYRQAPPCPKKNFPQVPAARQKQIVFSLCKGGDLREVLGGRGRFGGGGRPLSRGLPPPPRSSSPSKVFPYFFVNATARRSQRSL